MSLQMLKHSNDVIALVLVCRIEAIPSEVEAPGSKIEATSHKQFSHVDSSAKHMKHTYHVQHAGPAISGARNVGCNDHGEGGSGIDTSREHSHKLPRRHSGRTCRSECVVSWGGSEAYDSADRNNGTGSAKNTFFQLSPVSG